ncbi:phosphate transporter [Boothiomyces sp. JEL0866]|nr:phosphate transporter [Boothiomyces sp. JEL0866]
MSEIQKKDEQIVQIEDKEALRKEALTELDMSSWTAAHWRAVLVAGSGFLTDSYDNFVISLIVTIIGYVYYAQGPNKGKIPGVEAAWIKAMSSWGNLLGQFAFGIMGDVFGRKKMYGVELIILIVGAIGCALSAQPGTKSFGIAAILGFWRFVLGVGVGGDYPVSGVITSEFASAKNRGTMIALVFAMQGVGFVLGTVVALVSLSAFKDSATADPTNLDYVWRIMAGFGVVPALCAVYYRLTIPETPRFAIDVEGDVAKGAASANQFLKGGNVDAAEAVHGEVAQRKPYFQGLKEYFGKWGNFKVLIGTAMTWFLLDIGFYGTNLNTSTIVKYMGFVPPSDKAKIPWENVWASAKGSAVVNLIGALGYFFCVATVDRVGRKPLQMGGFVILTILFAIMASQFNWLTSSDGNTTFVIIYCLAQFFFNFGPNSTTFIVPAEAYPTHVRSSGHGISAAAGKLGAIFAAQLFDPVNSGAGIQPLLYIFTGVMAGGILFTFLIPETNGKTLEELGDYE